MTRSTLAARPQELGPDVKLTGVPLTKAINIVAAAYGVCVDPRPQVTAFSYCRALFARRTQEPLAARKPTRGAALLARISHRALLSDLGRAEAT